MNGPPLEQFLGSLLKGGKGNINLTASLNAAPQGGQPAPTSLAQNATRPVVPASLPGVPSFMSPPTPATAAPSAQTPSMGPPANLAPANPVAPPGPPAPTPSLGEQNQNELQSLLTEEAGEKPPVYTPPKYQPPNRTSMIVSGLLGALFPYGGLGKLASGYMTGANAGAETRYERETAEAQAKYTNQMQQQAELDRRIGAREKIQDEQDRIEEKRRQDQETAQYHREQLAAARSKLQADLGYRYSALNEKTKHDQAAIQTAQARNAITEEDSIRATNTQFRIANLREYGLDQRFAGNQAIREASSRAAIIGHGLTSAIAAEANSADLPDVKQAKVSALVTQASTDVQALYDKAGAENPEIRNAALAGEQPVATAGAPAPGTIGSQGGGYAGNPYAGVPGQSPALGGGYPAWYSGVTSGAASGVGPTGTQPQVQQPSPSTGANEKIMGGLRETLAQHASRFPTAQAYNQSLQATDQYLRSQGQPGLSKGQVAELMQTYAKTRATHQPGVSSTQTRHVAKPAAGPAAPEATPSVPLSPFQQAQAAEAQQASQQWSTLGQEISSGVGSAARSVGNAIGGINQWMHGQQEEREREYVERVNAERQKKGMAPIPISGEWLKQSEPGNPAEQRYAAIESTPIHVTGETMGGSPAAPRIHNMFMGENEAHPQPTATPLGDVVRSASERTGVMTPLLVAVIQQESGGNPGAVSRAGAQGLMQLMPGTAQDLGVDPTNPVQNILGGAAYLRRQLDKYHSIPAALAAYNMGPANYDNFLRGRIPMPSETRNYVNNIMAMYARMAQPPPYTEPSPNPQP